MAPQKQPLSLLTLARNEIGKLVLKTCIDIDTAYSFGEPSWHEEVDNLQAFLCQYIPACEWDPICSAVFRYASSDKSDLKDSRVIYATLVHRYMKTLVVKPLCLLTKSCRFYSISSDAFAEEDEIHRKFWLELIRKLVDIVDLNMMWIDCDRIYAAIGAHCNHLERLTYRSNGLEFVALLRNCTKLRYLRNYMVLPDEDFLRVQGKKALEAFPDLEEFDYYNMAEVMEAVVVSRPLNLRRFRQVNCSPLDVSIMVPLCPNLIDLDVDPDSVHSSAEIFKMLAVSSLRLTHLNIRNFIFDKNVEDFLTAKGNFIESFSMVCFKSNLNSAVLCVALSCKNLSIFQVDDYRNSFSVHQNPITTEKRSLFKHLSHFSYRGRVGLMEIPEFCLTQSSSLLTLTIAMRWYDDDEMIALFNVKHLTEVIEIDFSGIVTAKLLNHIYKHCPKLASIKIGGFMDREVTNCIELLQREAIDNNLDLSFEESKYGFGGQF